jgi:23S rRNA pseudouridine2605 synthase
LTAEQLEASRAERMRQNGHGALTIEDARTWIEETGLCLFLPRRQFSSSIAPSFVEAVAGHQNATPDPKHIKLAEELLVRLELDDVAVRLNLLGQPGEQPDFVVASWVLPYVYALRGDRDWRRSPQLTGSRQVSPLAVHAYKLLEAGDSTIAQLKHALGREVSETAVIRAITELWQQLRIIPVVAAPGVAAKWQLLRHRFQKAIAEGASTSQVTAISVLASIYLQAVIAASMEEVELFLAPLTARSKVREVLRGLVATRQVHTISMGHAPHFYVAGTLPEFTPAPTVYSSSSILASSYFTRTHDHEHEESLPEIAAPKPAFAAAPVPVENHKPAEAHTPRPPAVRKPASSSKPSASRPHFSRPAAHARDRKPAQSSAGSRPVRRPGADPRSASARPSGSRSANGSRPGNGVRWNPNSVVGAKAKLNGANGSRNGKVSSNGAHSNGNGAHLNGSTARPANGASGARTAKSSAPKWGQRNGHVGNGHSNGAKAPVKAGTSRRVGSLSRNGSSARPSGPRKDARPDARTSRSGSRKPALAAGAKAGNAKRYGFTARPKQETKKRG